MSAIKFLEGNIYSDYMQILAQRLMDEQIQATARAADQKNNSLQKNKLVTPKFTPQDISKINHPKDPEISMDIEEIKKGNTFSEISYYK